MNDQLVLFCIYRVLESTIAYLALGNALLRP